MATIRVLCCLLLQLCTTPVVHLTPPIMASAPSSAALERKQRLEHIQSFHLIASNMDNTLYDEDELKNINISIEPFTLTQNGMPTFSPCFFQPFMGDIKEDPYVEEVDDQTKWFPYNEEYDIPPSDWAQITYEFWIHYRFAQCYEYEQRTNFELPGIECREYASSRSSSPFSCSCLWLADLAFLASIGLITIDSILSS